MEYIRQFCAVDRKYTLWEGNPPEFEFYCLSCGESPVDHDGENYLSMNAKNMDKLIHLLLGDEHGAQ